MRLINKKIPSYFSENLYNIVNIKTLIRMTINRILLLSIFLVARILNVETYANAITTNPSYYWYIGSFLGMQFTANGNTKIPSIFSKPPLTSKPVYHCESTVGLNVGYKFYKSFRVEGEFAYQDFPMNKIIDAVGPDTVTNVKNSATELFSFFINNYYDLKLDQHWISYLGAGLGYVVVQNIIRPIPPIPVSAGLFFTKKELNYDTFGYQAVLGLAYQLSHNLIFNLNYKYFSTFKINATGRTNLGPDDHKTKQRVTSNAVSFGISYFFI